MRIRDYGIVAFAASVVWVVAGGVPASSMAQETAEAEVERDADLSEDYLEQAREQLAQDELDAGLKLLEKAIQADSENLLALFVAAQAYSQKGVQLAEEDRKAANKPLRRGAELMRELAKRKKELTEDEQRVLAVSVYNEACCLAIDEEADKAIARLEEAVELGFDDALTLENDPDFESLRNDERFQRILTDLQEKESTAPDEDADEPEA